MVSTKTRYVFQLCGPLPPATESLRACDTNNVLGPLWARLAHAEEMAAAKEELDKATAHHLACWDKYRTHRQLPPEWRGNTQILHYERIVCGMMRRVLQQYPTAVRLTVRRATWLRRIPRDEQQSAVAWFRELSDHDRRELCDSYRAEEEAREAEERYIESVNRRYARILRD